MGLIDGAAFAAGFVVGNWFLIFFVVMLYVAWRSKKFDAARRSDIFGPDAG